MENKIDWERKGYWNELDKYDGCFLSFHYDRAGVDECGWKELIKKYGLSTMVTIDISGENVSVYNDDYSIVITGNNCEEIPGYYIMLTFSKNIDMSKCIAFFKDFTDILDYDESSVREGIGGEFTSRPKEIMKAMIESL
jgi:hypothetical protein